MNRFSSARRSGRVGVETATKRRGIKVAMQEMNEAAQAHDACTQTHRTHVRAVVLR